MSARLGLKTDGYQTFFIGKWHLGESDYALPNAQGYDEMRYAGLSSQRLHLRRSDLVPRQGSGVAAMFHVEKAALDYLQPNLPAPSSKRSRCAPPEGRVKGRLAPGFHGPSLGVTAAGADAGHENQPAQ